MWGDEKSQQKGTDSQQRSPHAVIAGSNQHLGNLVFISATPILTQHLNRGVRRKPGTTSQGSSDKVREPRSSPTNTTSTSQQTRRRLQTNNNIPDKTATWSGLGVEAHKTFGAPVTFKRHPTTNQRSTTFGGHRGSKLRPPRGIPNYRGSPYPKADRARGQDGRKKECGQSIYSFNRLFILYRISVPLSSPHPNKSNQIKRREEVA